MRENRATKERENWLISERRETGSFKMRIPQNMGQRAVEKITELGQRAAEKLALADHQRSSFEFRSVRIPAFILRLSSAPALTQTSQTWRCQIHHGTQMF